MINTDNTVASSSSSSLSGAGGTSSAKESENSFNTDFQSFLTLLTAQLRNQDPLTPMDSTQFVEQLASFSGLEQQIETNKLLEEMVGASGVSELENATQWIGKEVDAPSGEVTFLGKPIEMRIPASEKGAPSEIVMRNNTTGAIVHQASLVEGQTSHIFDGKREDGTFLPNGKYEVTINYVNDDGDISSQDPIINAKVNEARLIEGSLKLVLDNGALIDTASIKAVREPAASLPIEEESVVENDEAGDETAVEQDTDNPDVAA